LPGSCCPPAHALAFTPDGQRLVLAAASGDIRVVDLDLANGTPHDAAAERPKLGAGARLVHCFEEHVDGVEPGTGGGDEGALPVSSISVSASGKWLVSASVSGAVYVFDLARLRHHWTASRWVARVVGLRFHSRDDILVCVDSSNAFRLLDVQKRRLA
ncbi:unnamed protein product, partial [Scytosiphon promiscuus]